MSVLHFWGLFCYTTSRKLSEEPMSTDTIAVELEKREVLRKGLNGLRAGGKIPAVIHNHGKESIHVSGDVKLLNKVYEQAGKHHPVELTIGSQKHLALIKDADFEPVKNRLRHLVFQAIRQNEAVEAEIPLVFKEDAEIPAEKLSLLVLKHLDHVEVKALPKDLPDQLVVDPSKLTEVGDTLTVADVVVPAGVTIITDLEQGIATVEMPKDQIAEADASAASLAEDAAKTGGDETTEASAEAAKEETEEE